MDIILTSVERVTYLLTAAALIYHGLRELEHVIVDLEVGPVQSIC